MTRNIKHVYTAYTLFDSVLDQQPRMTGMYQWMRVFNSPSYRIAELLQIDIEKFDVIQVNLDALDQSILFELKERLKGSSTLLVGNQDYSPDIWKTAFGLMSDCRHKWLQCDAMFATSPEGRDLMELVVPEKKVHLIPHPCETHVLKRFESSYKSKHILVFYHRYDNEVITPALVAGGLGIPVTLAGYLESYDQRARHTKCMFDNVIPSMAFQDFFKLIKEATLCYEPFTLHSYGRCPCDAACAGTPVAGSNRQWSMRILYPDTSFDPYDVKSIRGSLARLLSDEGWREHVVEQASYNVEFFNHKNSRERFMAMVDEVKK